MQQSFLQSPVSHLEIKQVLNQLSPWKSPGPDGLQKGFYKKNWHYVANDVQTLIHYLIEEHRSWKEINMTDIVLIPKLKSPSHPKDFIL